MSDILKRWLIIGGLLMITLWLVLTVPEVSTIDTVRVTKQLRTDKEVEKTENELTLQPRFVAEGITFDVFGTQNKRVSNQIKPLVKVRQNPKMVIQQAPRMPFKYIGQLAENGTTKIFLMKGDALYIVKEGDNIELDYKLEKVEEEQLSILYMPLDITQTINIGRTH